jgi:enoyl-CoA hydratase/carnithine racemase
VSVLRTDEPAEGVLRLRLDRPAKRNAVDRELAEALVEAFGSSDAKVVILGSSGPEAFCAGLDLSLEPAERVAVSDLLYETYERMLASPAPIVASIPGPAIGGGAQLAIAADLRVAGPTAQIRFAGPGHGLAVGAWGLGSLVGRGRAMDLCLSMRPVSADEAAAMGLVDRIADDPDAEALELATRLVRLDGPTVARVKRLVTSDGLVEALRRERRDNMSTWSGEIPEGSLTAPSRDDA